MKRKWGTKIYSLAFLAMLHNFCGNDAVCGKVAEGAWVHSELIDVCRRTESVVFRSTDRDFRNSEPTFRVRSCQCWGPTAHFCTVLTSSRTTRPISLLGLTMIRNGHTSINNCCADVLFRSCHQWHYFKSWGVFFQSLNGNRGHRRTFHSSFSNILESIYPYLGAQQCFASVISDTASRPWFEQSTLNNNTMRITSCFFISNGFFSRISGSTITWHEDWLHHLISRGMNLWCVPNAEKHGSFGTLRHGYQL